MTVRVVLAGHNVDRQGLQQLMEQVDGTEPAGNMSPESVTAAYGLISRDSRDLTRLREDTRQEVERARQINLETIREVGHAAVAEHAVFNLDVIGLSRLALEQLKRHRLASFTERSQTRLEPSGDFIMPAEFAGCDLEAPFRHQMQALVEFERELSDGLKRLARFKGDPDAGSDGMVLASQDARYALPLCTASQLGMTVNARNLEWMITRCVSHSLDEVRHLGQALCDAVRAVAPSVIRVQEPSPYLMETSQAIHDMATCMLPESAPRPINPVRLVDHTPDPDPTVAAALVHESGNCPWTIVRKQAGAVEPMRLEALFAELFRRMQVHDRLPRAFEFVNFTFEVVASSVAHAYLNRHRMATITVQDYDPVLGRTIPESIRDLGLDDDFNRLLDETDRLYWKLAEVDPRAACYCLTNAHCRRILIRINGRELGHLARLRCDAHAQWDVRGIANSMVAEARKVMPLASAFYGGQDCFEEIRKNLAL